MSGNSYDREDLTAKGEPDGEILVAAQAFAEFDLWMDFEVEKLVARWIHLAAPGASKPRKIKAKKAV